MICKDGYVIESDKNYSVGDIAIVGFNHLMLIKLDKNGRETWLNVTKYIDKI